MDNLFLVERQSQVADLLKKGMRSKGRWIAAGPSAMWALEQEGINYQIPEDFCDSQRLNELCMANRAKVEWLCHQLDDLLLQQFPKLKVMGMQPYYFHIFSLNAVFDALVRRIYELKSILAACADSSIWTHIDKPQPWTLFDGFFDHKETLYGQLLALAGWNHEINLLEQPGNQDLYCYQPSNRPDFFKKLEDFIVKRFKLRNMVTDFRDEGLSAVPGFFRQKSHKSLLVYGGTYEWSSVLPFLKRNGWKFYYSDDRTFHFKSKKDKVTVQEVEGLISGKPDFMNCFESHGISFLSILLSRLTWIMNSAPGKAQKTIAEMSKLIRKYKIKALLTATSATFTSHVVAQTARNSGLPVICWQHGHVGGNNNNIQLNEYNDMMTSGTLFTYGDAVSSAYEQFADKFARNVISIGSANLDQIKGQTGPIEKEAEPESSSKRILYVTSPYYESKWYNGFSPPWSDQLLYKEQSLIIKHLLALTHRYETELKVYVKLHPSAYSEDPCWVAGLSGNPGIEVIKHKLSFTQLMETSDIIIIDAPTTTILQAAATAKPVFTHLNIVGCTDEAKKLLDKRVICTDAADELMQRLNRYLETGQYDADVHNREFLKSYGTHIDDGKSSQRALNELLGIIDHKGV